MPQLTAQKEIIAALDGALEATRALALSDDPLELAIVLHYAEHDPRKVDPRVPRLIATLAKDPSLDIFDGRMVVVPSSAMRVEYYNLASWLLRRGAERTSAEAVAELNRYLQATEIPCLMTVVLAGLNVKEDCDLGGGVRLLPWDGLPDSALKRQIQRRALEGLGFHWPTAAIVRQEKLPKRHVTQEEFQGSGQHLTAFDDAGLQDALLCVGMIGPSAPYAIAMFLGAPAWVPVGTGGLMMPYIEGWPLHTEWLKTQCSEARTLHLAFLQLKESRKALIRLAMQRLNRAMRRVFPVDAAIDLGIALEALFLSDMDEERGEPTFRLRIRAARYLGSTKADREHLFRLVGDLYGARSSAVHTGHVSDKLGGRPISEALAEGYSVAATAIRRMILEGLPDWGNVMFV